MSTSLLRVPVEVSRTLTNAVGTSPSIDLSGYSTISVFVPSGYNSTTLTVHAHSETLGAWLPANDANGDAIEVTTVAAGEARNIPAEVFNYGVIRLVTNNAADNSTAVGVILKA